jgi:hypothetical protein
MIGVGYPVHAAAKLSSRQPGHWSAAEGANNRDAVSESKGPSERTVSRSVPPKCHRDRHTRERLHHDGRSHDREERAIEGRAEIEVTGRSAVSVLDR